MIIGKLDQRFEIIPVKVGLPINLE